MAQSKLTISFMTPTGLEAQLEITPGEREDSMALLKLADKKLAEAGCKPRPIPARGGYGGGGAKAKPPVPEKCPVCQTAIVEKSGVNAQTGRAWKLHVVQKMKFTTNSSISKIEEKPESQESMGKAPPQRPGQKMLSQAQLAQRQAAGKARSKAFTKEYQRAAGLALKEQVSKDYYRFVGRQGGRKNLYNWFSYLGEHYELGQDRPELVKEWQHRWGEAKAAQLVAQWNEERRADFRELAERYRDESGTKLMLALFKPEHDQPKAKRKRTSPAKQQGAPNARHNKTR